MKLTLIGGGGMRTPFFMAAALRRAGRIGLKEICLMDSDERKLAIIGGLCQEMVRAAGSPFRVTTTPDASVALDGARHVVTSIRVGCEPARVLDERIALKHGVLGQETTGPGGFAMALRSVPAILGYAELLKKLSPGAWIYNFTNPSGLVTQALRDAGFERAFGICDSANAGQHAVSKYMKVKNDRLRAEVFGLNHLSWTRRVWLDDKDVLEPLLNDGDFISTSMLRMFDPGLIQQTGMWLNEYLFYFHYAERALAKISSEEITRGEEILELNQRIFSQLEKIGVQENPRAALQAFYTYEQRRMSTYMHYALPDAPSPEQADGMSPAVSPDPTDEEDGYAGVALSLIEALENDKTLYIALNVPNNGAIHGMQETDVVEVSCRVDGSGIRALPIGVIPEPQLMLMKAIKLYERLTLEAIRTHSRQTAIQALMVHPLVLSYSRAQALVNDYLSAHAAYVGSWD